MATGGRRTRATARPAGTRDAASDIVDAALELAQEKGWGSLSLHELAASRKLSLTELSQHFRDKDAIADAWFGRALNAMLAPTPKNFDAQPTADRLYFLMMRWFDALAPCRTVTCQMLAEKMHLPHAHHWVPMVFNLSRLIQWLRDAALLRAEGRRRQIEEIGLTMIFVATLRLWCRDSSLSQERTREYLRHRLARADRTMARLFRPGAD